MSSAIQISDEVRKAMEAIRLGADVSDYVIAGTLRDLEKTNPGWLNKSC